MAELVEIHAVDMVILAESASEPRDIVQHLNDVGHGGFQVPRGLSECVGVFPRFPREYLQPIFESDRVSIQRLSIPERLEILVSAVHLPSKLHWSEASQAFACHELARQIAKVEVRVGHRRTVLLGDFNMNPFEPGLVSAVGLNAVMSRRVAARSSRTVQSAEYPFFYNLMWGHFGDSRGETAGTYYYDSSEHVKYYWNVFDQVLVKPELADNFDSSQLKILTAIGQRSLVRQDGCPNKSDSSDHLPLIFDLHF